MSHAAEIRETILQGAQPIDAGTSLQNIETPAALVDLSRLALNLVRTAGYCREHRLGYRPHAKTHKSALIGKAQLVAGASGLTVATLREAEVMAEVCDDLLLAYPQVGDAKLSRLLKLAERVKRLSVALDSAEALAPLALAARSARVELGVMVEWDAGMGRVGVQTPADAVALARGVSDSKGLRYDGLMFYPGHIRDAGEAARQALGTLRTRLIEMLDVLQRAELKPLRVSGGSTPTLWSSHQVPELTEVRPGTTVFNDRTTTVTGASTWDECAYSILATVVSTAVPGQVVIDAGSKALSREELRGAGGGYGALLGRPEILVSALSEEHGIVDLRQTDWRPRVGDRVRVVPNHVCVSVNLQEQIWGLDGGELCCRWPVEARGRFAQPLIRH